MVGRAEAMLRHDRHLFRPEQIIVGDRGFGSTELETFITSELEATMIRPDRRPDRRPDSKDEKPRFGKRGGIFAYDHGGSLS